MEESSNWVVQNLQNALATWNNKLSEIWLLITQSPEEFKDGTIWTVITNIHGALQAIGYSLLVLFFVVGVMKTCGSFAEIKRPEIALKMFIRFVLAKASIDYGLELMTSLFEIVQGIVSKIMETSGLSSTTETVLSFIMIMTVYGRFFKIYLYTAIAPVPLSSFAGEPSSSVGKSFVKSYAAVCLEGAIIVLGCIIFSVFAASPPVVDESAAAVNQVWSYVGELIFNMIVLVGTVKMSDRIVREMMGL